MNFRFSLLITVYRGIRPEWLELCLGSVYAQTLRPDQLVLVLDGELADGCRDVISSYQNRSSSISMRLVRKQGPSGAGAAANFGLKYCEHPWIARLDADDLAAKERFELQAKYLSQYPQTDVLSSYLTEYSRLDEKEDGRLRPVPLNHSAIMRMMKYRSPVNNSCVMLRASKLRQAGGYESLETHEDYLLWMKLSAAGCLFANLPQSLVKVRMDAGALRRRNGVYAIKQEYGFQSVLLQRKYISFAVFLRNLLIRIPPRMLPAFLLNIFYAGFLRRKAS